MALCLLQVYVRYSRLEEYSSSTYLLSDFNKLFDVYTAKRIGMSKVNLSRNQRNPGLNLKNYSFSIQLNAPVSTSYPHTLLCVMLRIQNQVRHWPCPQMASRVGSVMRNIQK